MANVFWIVSTLLYVVLCITTTQAQFEDNRCICICPDTAVINGTLSNRNVYKQTVPPSKCDCDNVVLPIIRTNVVGHEKEFCSRCECKYESRNSTTMKVVVILVIWITSLLVVYMLFLLCLDPLLNKRRSAQPANSYQEQTNEDDDLASSIGSQVSGAGASGEGMAQPLRMRPNVLGRVGVQQDKWKRQVQEQRRNIYDKHVLLN